MMAPGIQPVNDLMEAFQKGNQPAFTCVFNYFNKSLCSFARALIKEKTAAEDIVQEIFIKCWQKHADFNSLPNLKAFLYISTRNACLNYLQQAEYQARVRQTLRFNSDDSQPSVLLEIIRAEVLRELRDEIDKLPPKCRNIFILCYQHGKTVTEISHELNIASRTVINQRVRGIQLIKKRLDKIASFRN
jgi:RNA polymerase sigma-70 factor (family 1)